MILIWVMQANEWVASNRILVFSQRFLVSPRCKHYDCFEVQNNHYGERSSLFRRCFIRIGLGNVETREANNHEIWGKIHRLTFHHAQGLLWNWHLAHLLVSKFKHIGYKSPKNNSIKPFQFCLRVLSLLLASGFFLGLAIQKSATTTTSKQQGIEMVCLGILYYRGALKWLNTYTASLLW